MATPKKRPKPPVRVSDQEIINAVGDAQGDYHAAASKLKISYGTLLCRARRCPEIYDTKLECLGDMVQMAEANVYDKLLAGDFPASKFVLERLARSKWGVQQDNGAGAWPEPIGDPHGA